MTAQPAGPMQLLVSIVERGKGAQIIEYYKSHRMFSIFGLPDWGLQPHTRWTRWALVRRNVM